MTINWIGEILDTIVSSSGKWARWLNARGKGYHFLISAVNCIYWMIRDFQLELYSQGMFCFVSIALHIYGYWYWKKNGIGKK